MNRLLKIGGDGIMSRVLTVLLISGGLFGQDAVPAGTILPIQLNSSLRSTKMHVGQAITARLMQDVPLGKGSKIAAGARVVGRVTAVQNGQPGSGEQLSLRFDELVTRHQRIPIVTNLRALANMMDVEEAQIPETGPDHGTPEYIWTTEQIGGETLRHGGGPLIHGSTAIGTSVAGSALAVPASKPGTQCRGEVDDNHQPQALWLFSSDACGLYDLPNVLIAHAGRSEPTGEITLRSTRGELLIRGGSGLLLRVQGDRTAPKDQIGR